MCLYVIRNLSLRIYVQIWEAVESGITVVSTGSQTLKYSKLISLRGLNILCVGIVT